MHCFRRMQKQRRRAGGAERGRNLARHNSAFAHAGDHHPAAARGQRVDSPAKSLPHRPAQAVSQRAQGFRLNANYVAANFVHCREDQPKW